MLSHISRGQKTTNTLSVGTIHDTLGGNLSYLLPASRGDPKSFMSLGFQLFLSISASVIKGLSHFASLYSYVVYFSYKDVSHIGLSTTQITSFNLITSAKTLFSNKVTFTSMVVRNQISFVIQIITTIFLYDMSLSCL
jgi:hypothetical protein